MNQYYNHDTRSFKQEQQEQYVYLQQLQSDKKKKINVPWKPVQLAALRGCPVGMELLLIFSNEATKQIPKHMCWGTGLFPGIAWRNRYLNQFARQQSKPLKISSGVNENGIHSSWFSVQSNSKLTSTETRGQCQCVITWLVWWCIMCIVFIVHTYPWNISWSVFPTRAKYELWKVNKDFTHTHTQTTWLHCDPLVVTDTTLQSDCAVYFYFFFSPGTALPESTSKYLTSIIASMTMQRRTSPCKQASKQESNDADNKVNGWSR